MSKSGRDIGGSSLWGSLFDVVIEKYHWTFDYLIWGISFVNVQMLLSDSIYHSVGDYNSDTKKQNDKTYDAGSKEGSQLLNNIFRES